MSARIHTLFVIAAVALTLTGCSARAGVSLAGAGSPDTGKSPTPVAMGERTWAGDFAISVTHTGRTNAADGAKAGKGKLLMIVQFDLRNGGTSGADVTAADFALTDESSTEYKPLPLSGRTVISNNPQYIGAGTARSLAIVYEIPAGGGPFVWRFSPTVQSGQPKTAILVVR